MARFSFSDHEYSVTHAGETIQLLPKEYALFQYLFENKQRVFTREELLNRVWPMEEPSDRTVDDHIYRLRKKLKIWDHMISIETIRGRGYRLNLKESSKTENPLLQDADLAEQVEKIFHKYHLFGHGEAMRMLAHNQETLGVELNPELAAYVRIMSGDFNWLVETREIHFREKAFYLLHLYYYIHFDTEKTLEFFESAYKRNIMPEERQKEMILNLVWLYIETGRMEQAAQQMKQAREVIVSENLKGFLSFLLIKEIFFLFATGQSQKTEEKIKATEEFLTCNPYLREQGIFHVIKGLWLLRKNQKKEALELLDEGLAILKRSRFVPHYLFAVRTILLFLDRYVEAPDLQAQYLKLWDELARRYQFAELKQKIERELQTHL